MNINELLKMEGCGSVNELFNFIKWLKECNEALKEALNNITNGINTIKELL